MRLLPGCYRDTGLAIRIRALSSINWGRYPCILVSSLEIREKIISEIYPSSVKTGKAVVVTRIPGYHCRNGGTLG